MSVKRKQQKKKQLLLFLLSTRAPPRLLVFIVAHILAQFGARGEAARDSGKNTQSLLFLGCGWFQAVPA